MKLVICVLKTILFFPFYVIKNIIRNYAYDRINEERVRKKEEPIKY